jgi:ribose transport system ATP-binding protein
MNDTSQHSGIEITGLHKRYDGVEALKGVTLSVPPGEIAGLIGPDGAGKTTAMKIICGLRTRGWCALPDWTAPRGRIA